MLSGLSQHMTVSKVSLQLTNLYESRSKLNYSECNGGFVHELQFRSI